MRHIEASELGGLLQPGMTVWVSGSSNEPVTLLNALAAHPEAARGVSFLQFPLPGINGFDFSALTDAAAFTTFFLTPALREGFEAGRVRFVPMHLRNIHDYLGEHTDVVFTQVAHDRDGALRLGPNADFYAAARRSARLVVAELNTGIVAPLGAPRIEEASIDYVLQSERGHMQMAPAVPDETAAQIGGHVASLIQDGDCIQTGIGSIPAAILEALADKNDLGLHGGLLDDGGRALIERGVVTGSRKTAMPGEHVTGMLLGSRALHAFAAERADVVLAPASVTHDAGVIGGIDHFVSVNSAVEVDLYGQVNAEVVGGRQISGVGGAVDFMRGARLSRGGRSIIAMTSTARRGAQSRIVPLVAMVTAPRTDVDMVVTEFGVARLFGTSPEERREALIEIAHPDFQDELRQA